MLPTVVLSWKKEFNSDPDLNQDPDLDMDPDWRVIYVCGSDHRKKKKIPDPDP
jgi:hypothetical protein